MTAPRRSRLPDINDFRDEYTVAEMLALIDGYPLEAIAEALCWQIHLRARADRKREEAAQQWRDERRRLLGTIDKAGRWWNTCLTAHYRGRKTIRLDHLGEQQ